MTDVLNKIHPQFKLNGISYNHEELKEVAYSLVKEGTSYEITIGDFLLDWLSNSSFIEVRSSGTTTASKTISLKKEQMLNSARASADFLGLEEGNTALLCLPMEYIAGKMMLVRAMALGLSLYYVVPSSSPLENTKRLFDFSAMIPLQLNKSLQHLEKIKILLVGGAPLTETLKLALRENKNDIYETFGMTETITHIALKKLSGNSIDDNFKTLKNVTVTVDKRNCLVINAPKVCAEKVITNDMVKLISETAFQWLGRIDNMINSGGVKIHPEQLEDKLFPYIQGRFFVSGIAEDTLGEKLVLVVEGLHDTTSLMSKIRALKTLEKYEFPKNIYSLPSFVLTKSGKIKRSENLSLLGI